ncbi:diguanylate cyclase domain-containing protein [Planococcus lenghuensis]|uniref:Diguanylate cyclase n=1 Tax=Planococcus lenghuensis TaxID=2213202 RepID=A0A1Q2KZ75_9BACL|nr:diguanylate cyclase [Planococcus lenghuensis]AQQ53510.1 hypothetical protein B0X71_10785 [Planococcus lenghuensis]
MRGPFSERQLALLYDKTSDLVVYLEREGDTYTYRYLNPAAYQSLGGISPGSAVNTAGSCRMTEELRYHCNKALMTESISVFRTCSETMADRRSDETAVTPIKSQSGEFVLVVTRDITAQRETEEDQLLFHALIRHSVDPVIIVWQDETIYTMSSSFEKMFGIEKEAYDRKPLVSLPGITASDAEFIRKTLNEVQEGGESTSVPIRWQKADGMTANFLASCSPVREQKGVRAYFIALTEFTEKFQLKEDLKQTENILESYKKALNYSALVAISSPAGKLMYVNDNYVSLTGFTANELIGTSIAETDKRFLPETEVAAIAASIRTGEIWRGQIKQQTKAGGTFWTDTTIIPLTDAHGRTQQVLSIRFDITDKKLAESRLKRLAYTDSLTRLPNRRFLSKTFPALKQQADQSGSWIGVLYIDGDNFKEVNDLFGHETGDDFIFEFGQALKRSIRKKDLVGRIGGDEFLILLADVSPAEAAENLAEISRRIRENLSRGWRIAEQSFSPSASIGAAFYPNDGSTLEELFRSGDAALLEAKKQGKNRLVMYSDLHNTGLPGH